MPHNHREKQHRRHKSAKDVPSDPTKFLSDSKKNYFLGM